MISRSSDTHDVGAQDKEHYDLMGGRSALIAPNHRALGVQVNYIYDRDRLIKVDYPTKTDVTFTYGAVGAANYSAGRLITTTDETGTLQHEYGALGEVRRSLRTVLDPSARHPSPVVFDLHTTTDSFGRQLRISYPDGEAVTNTYDAADVLSSVGGAGSGWSRIYVSGLTYDVFGNRDHATYGNGDVSTWTFDPKRIRLTSLVTTLAGTTTQIQNLQYTYDPASNPLTINNNLPPTPTNNSLPGTATQTFTYDGVDRLLTGAGSGTLNANKTTNYTQAYTYSPSHNILHKTEVHQTINNGGHIDFPSATNYDSAYGYGVGRRHLPTTIGAMSVAYDPSGDPITRTVGSQVEHLTWDDDKRLVQATGMGANQTSFYDASGLRVIRDGTNPTIFSSPFFDYDTSSTGTKHVFAGSMRVASVQAKFKSGANPTAPTKQGTAYFFHENHLGSTGVVSTESGDVNDAHEYFPDGGDWIDSGKGNSVDGFLFSGQPFDSDTGFYDFGQRFYDPKTSLWQGVDSAFTLSPEKAVHQSSYLSPLAFSGHSAVRNRDLNGNDFGDIVQIVQRVVEVAGGPARGWIKQGMQKQQEVLNPGLWAGHAYEELQHASAEATKGDLGTASQSVNNAEMYATGGAFLVGTAIAGGPEEAGAAALGEESGVLSKIGDLLSGIGRESGGGGGGGGGGGRLALGLSKHLDAFAAKQGATTWKSFPNPSRWRPTMLQKLADPNTKILFNLEGGVDLEAWEAVSRASRGEGGATDWELLQIQQNPHWWDTIEWWNGSDPAANPFK